MTAITTCQLPSGVSVRCRPMTDDEADRFDELRNLTGPDTKLLPAGFSIGCCLLENDGSQVFTQEVDQTDIGFSRMAFHDCRMCGEDILAFIRHLDLLERSMPGVIRRNRQSRD